MHAPRAVIASLVGERRGPLQEETASHELEVARAVGATGGADEGVSATQRMICVSVEISDGPVTRRVRVTAPSICRALALVGDGKPGREVRLVFCAGTSGQRWQIWWTWSSARRVPGFRRNRTW